LNLQVCLPFFGIYIIIVRKGTLVRAVLKNTNVRFRGDCKDISSSEMANMFKIIERPRNEEKATEHMLQSHPCQPMLFIIREAVIYPLLEDL